LALIFEIVIGMCKGDGEVIRGVTLQVSVLDKFVGGATTRCRKQQSRREEKNKWE